MESTHLSAPILATLTAATVSSVGADRARLTITETQESMSWPLEQLPRGVGVGATVYLRTLSAAAANDEADEVARRVLEQFLN